MTKYVKRDGKCYDVDYEPTDPNVGPFQMIGYSTLSSSLVVLTFLTSLIDYRIGNTVFFIGLVFLVFGIYSIYSDRQDKSSEKQVQCPPDD